MTTAHPLDFDEQAFDAYYTKRDALTALVEDGEPTIDAPTPARSRYEATFLESERELGESIGYPALVYHKTEPRPDRYYYDAHDLMDENRPLRDTDIMDRLNEQDDDLTRLRAQLDATRQHVDAEIVRLMRVERDLRIALDQAHQHIGALVKAGEEAYDALNECGPMVDHALVLPAMDALHVSSTAARAWLRRA